MVFEITFSGSTFAGAIGGIVASDFAFSSLETKSYAGAGTLLCGSNQMPIMRTSMLLTGTLKALQEGILTMSIACFVSCKLFVVIVASDCDVTR